jgi:hypothetical protein
MSLQTHLKQLLKTAWTLKEAGYEQQAIAMGPDILLAYFAEENGYELPRMAPRTFREKLYCRMLDAHENGAPLFTRLSDKVKVRSYVAERIGEQYLTKLLWQGAEAASIPWGTLPEVSVLKCAEGSGKNLVLKKPFDLQHVADLCAQWQATSYYWFRREFHYIDVPRHLLIEEMLTDGHPDGPIDYIFFCFDGVPQLIQVGSRSHMIHRFFSTNWQPLELSYRKDYVAPDIQRPAQLDEMLTLAAQLSRGFDFVRVDLYACNNAIKFGELTFTPRAGHIPFQPDHWNEVLGAFWNYRLPDATDISRI